jgi:riboflavin kinase/FMN adenylyltransferase
VKAIFTVAGRVVGGKRLGRAIGFPTANLAYEESGAYPSDGVYAAFAEIDGARYAAVLNQGKHPTLPEGPRTIEAHLINFSGDLYGREMALHYVAYLRPERKFESPDALGRQLREDIKNALRALSEA